jgi:cysteinyl-tRNA synthetase
MSKRYLATRSTCGRVDLMFPHHENEIAQSEAANHKQFARVAAPGSVRCNRREDAEGAGGFTTLRDLVAAGHDPLAIRYFLIANAHPPLARAPGARMPSIPPPSRSVACASSPIVCSARSPHL